MQTNLIQNFVHKQKAQPTTPEKKAPDFDIHHEIKNKNFVKPSKSTGYLVKGNLFDAPAIMAKDFAYDMKSLKDGLKGDANDHQLGKINDIGMKLGGLAIAGYLYTKRQSPMTKAMEFVGLGSFFASMALWPKIAIQLPSYLIHGFNVQQQYVDSFGRKKPFFQDPQFLAWDAYSDEKINKIGDWMGVPKNIPNRREFIQQKMQKVAIQDNTLWMLTAGFATPVMSALICNSLEKPIEKLLGRINNKKNNKNIKNIEELAKSMQHDTIKKKVNNVISINQSKVLTDDLVEEIGKAITSGFEPQVKESVIKDLKQLLKADMYMINENTLNAMVDNAEAALIDAGIEKETVQKLIPSYDELLECFDKEKGFFKNAYKEDKLDEIFTVYDSLLSEKLKKYNESTAVTLDKKVAAARQQKLITRTLIHPESDKNPIMSALKKERYGVLNHNNQKVVKSIAEAFNSLKANLDAAEYFTLKQLGCAPETTMANFWNDTIDIFVKGLRITPKQIEKIRNDRLFATEFLRGAFDDIASDKKRYKEFMTGLIDQYAKLDKIIKPADTRETMYSNADVSKIEKFIDKSFKDFNTKITSIPGFSASAMQFTLESLIGTGGQNFENKNTKGAFIEFYKSLPDNRIAEVKSSFFRIINTLDLYRRLAYGDKTYYPALHDKLPRELKEEIVELSKLTGISGHTSDYLTKFYRRINPDRDISDCSDIQIRNGRLIYKYVNKSIPKQKVDMPQDGRLFTETMKLSFENNILPETENAFGHNSKLLAEFKKYRKMILNDVGDVKYFEHIHRKVNEAAKDSNATDNKIFTEIGAATDEILYNYSKRAFNTNKWIKMFTTAGAALLGVTVLAQFFFGRMQTPKPAPVQKDKQYA